MEQKNAIYTKLMEKIITGELYYLAQKDKDSFQIITKHYLSLYSSWLTNYLSEN